MPERESMPLGQVAKALSVSDQTVRRYLAAGHLEGFVLPSGYRRIYRDSVDKLIKARAPQDLDTVPY